MTPEERERDRIRGEHLSGWIGLLTALAFAATAITFGIQALLWLKSGAWHPVSIASALGWLGLNPLFLVAGSWHGLNQIVAWVLELHLGVGFIAAGVVVGFCIGEAVNAFSNTKKSSAA
jgi:hypothetical protein